MCGEGESSSWRGVWREGIFSLEEQEGDLSGSSRCEGGGGGGVSLGRWEFI